jgi:hypothetical protein
MRAIGILTALCALLLTAVGLQLPTWGLTQEITPVAQPSIEALAFASAGKLPPSPGAVGLLRLTFPAGTVLPLEPGDPSLALVYVEAGTLSVRIEAPVTVSRAPKAGTAEPTQEEIPAGTGFVAGPGDSFISPAVIAGEARNDGPEPVVVLAAVVEPDVETTAAPVS